MITAIADKLSDRNELCDKKIVHSLEEHDEPDYRIDQSPSQIVQSKLISVLPRGLAVPVSCLHTSRFVSRYSNAS